MTAGHYIRTDEHRAKMKEIMRDKNRLFERCMKISNALKGRQFSKAHCENISRSKKGKSIGSHSAAWKKHQSEGLAGRLPWNKDKHLSPEHRKKIGDAHRGMWRSAETCRKIKEKRKQQICPKKDTSIEVKIQMFLKQLEFKFLTHQYMNEIQHSYQCDIYIPIQDGIIQKTVIECDGDYFHHYSNGTEQDRIRTEELRVAGFRVIRLWECDINKMTLEEFSKIVLQYVEVKQ